MEAWNILVSPTKHEYLSLDESSSHLISAYSGRLFPIVDGIPILLPIQYIADWASNVLEVVYLNDAFSNAEETIQIYGQDGYKEAMRERIRRDLGILGVKAAFERYSKMPEKERLECFLFGTAQDRGWADRIVDDATLSRSQDYKTSSNGQKRFGIYSAALEDHPAHLPDYTSAVAQRKSYSIVELGCGSGFGSCAVIEFLSANQLFFPIDVDYACTANCVGIGKWLGKSTAVCPVVASFWYLPFPDRSIDVICSHFGMDETREIPRVLQEAARVLKNKGKLVTVSKTDPAERLRFYLDGLGFSHEDLCGLAFQAGLYAGQQALIETAADRGLKMLTVKSYTPQDRGHRTLYVFERR